MPNTMKIRHVGGAEQNDGFIVKSTKEIDFGNGEFQQLVAYIGHDGERYTEYMEFYIDEVKPENMVARTWTGINI